jgi:capsular exopolysaccharide synthesis family protein
MSDDNQEDGLHLRDNLEKYLSHWQWFVLGVFICISFALVYLRYVTPQYLASTTVLVKDDKKGGMLSELSAFADMGMGNAVKSNIDNEIEILKSRTLIESAVKKLKLNVSIFEKGRINKVEVFDDASIHVDFINLKPNFYKESISWDFVKLSDNTFGLESNIEEKYRILLTSKKEFRYGELIPTRNGGLVITKVINPKSIDKQEDRSIFIKVDPLENVTASYQKRIAVSPISKTSSVVEISITDPVAKKAEVFLDNLINIYNEDAVADKNFISENTSRFISNRLVLISKELEGVEEGVETFKQSNGLTDIESEAKLFIEGSSEYNNKSVENEIQMNVVSSMIDFLKKSKNGDLLPANLISTQGDSRELIQTYNQLVLERNRILKSATVDNPSVVKLEQQLLSLKSNVAESLRRAQSSLTIQKRNLKGEELLLDSKIGKIPVQERQFRAIARQQKVKEELYLYLLQKREETAISLAATAPNARVIDSAKASIFPVSPKNKIVYLAAFLLGLLIPFCFIYAKELLDTKVKSRSDITDKSAIPYLGDIPNSPSPNEIIAATSRTSTAEALRIVRANLDFMLAQVPDGKAKTVFFTSTIPGEGKTFVSFNLASIFAHSEKKVLLIGMDIRKPKLNDFIGIKEPRGLTDYLSSKNVSITDYIYSLENFKNFDVLLSGAIPPNPTEILMSSKLNELLDQLQKEYDYIFVDTAPISLVSDTFIVAENADAFVYVVRANYLDKRMLALPINLHSEGKLPNMSFVLNDTSVTKGYGYGGYGGYGYGGDEIVERSWYKKIFKK